MGLLKKMVLGKLQTHNQRIALQFHLTPSTNTKLDSKWIRDLKETSKTVKIWKKSGNSVMTLAWVCFFGNEPRIPGNDSEITQLIDIT